MLWVVMARRSKPLHGEAAVPFILSISNGLIGKRRFHRVADRSVYSLCRQRRLLLVTNRVGLKVYQWGQECQDIVGPIG